MRSTALSAPIASGIAAICCVSMAAPARALPGESAEQAAYAFMEAFASLDSVRFNAFFAEDVTMFFPSGPFPKSRVEGKEAVIKAFGLFFGMAKERGATRLTMQPLDMKVQDYGGFAIATFHLRGNGNVGRRSITFRRDAGDWRIIHFHASALEEAK